MVAAPFVEPDAVISPGTSSSMTGCGHDVEAGWHAGPDYLGTRWGGRRLARLIFETVIEGAGVIRLCWPLLGGMVAGRGSLFSRMGRHLLGWRPMRLGGSRPIRQPEMIWLSRRASATTRSKGTTHTGPSGPDTEATSPSWRRQSRREAVSSPWVCQAGSVSGTT